MKFIYRIHLLILVIVLFGFFNSRCDEMVDLGFDNSSSRGIEDYMGLDEISLDSIEQFESDNKDLTRMDDFELKTAARYFSQFEAPLWNNTKAPAGRDILYHIPYKISSIQYGGIAANIFLNVTNKMQVSSKSLVNFDQEIVKSMFELFLQPIPADEVSSLIPLLGHITIQERKFGALIQGGLTKGFFNIQLHTSLLMAERNFWLTPHDQDEVEKIMLQYRSDTTFDESEMYIIRYGLGDTRLKVGCNTLNMTDFQTDLGFEFIIPTSRLSHNTKLNANPDDLFAQLVTENQQDIDNEKLQESMGNLLRGVRDYLIDPQLGNGYFGVGGYIESKFDIFHNLAHIWVRASYDKLFPATEDRLFMYNVTMQPSDLVADGVGPKELRNGLMQTFVKQYVFPTAFKAEVYPGGIFNFVLALSALVKHVNLALGYDLYAQQRERIRQLYNTTESLQSLVVDEAETDSILQNKIFAEATYVKNLRRTDIGVGLGGDVAVSSKGLGDDWTVYLKIAGTF
jgi:hypothetical protein